MDTINSSLPFDPFATPFGTSGTVFNPDFSPISLFSPQEDFGFSTDFASESAGSPASHISPVSPVLSASSYGFPATDEWTSWDTIEHSPEPESFFKNRTFDGSLISPLPPRKPSLSPAINPMDLTVPLAPVNYYQSPPTVATPLSVQQPSKASITLPVEVEPAKRYPSRNLKRKSSTSASEEGESSPKRSSLSPPPTAGRHSEKESQAPKKTAHNMIEKRYRTNLNDKIAQLRDAVPALRVVAQRLEHATYDDAEDGFMDQDLGLAQVPKLNKATVLSKATEYIMQLEGRNRSLETENSALRGRMEGLEILLLSRGGAAGVWN
ncbi:helix-loop-helix DNA-binding domain-containing protein [Lasiosphaeria hispida]|uniref:Helix-loop-helix DNA-binding domain-containing protein n=1 Tax=Lasiosphaeria hispida TaxID=260671 RepID=A0AAJ0ML50_9PEZI|nr:helix-loop-helix DNA-binding domain-containing protein [Lasiosphaeria hispida]